MHLVIVESPAKAKTINKYLGRDYKVLASYGHVRDLPPKDGSVEPDKNFVMHYETEARGAKQIKAIADALADADHLVLATDPDREGEAIAWHVLEALKNRRAIKKDLKVSRVVFNEITKSAVSRAMQEPRMIDMDLVNAQQARRALDYLVGFTLSPLLWRKLPGAKSAGRVQSVALRLVCEREMEIEAFRAREYWSVTADLKTASGQPFTANLVALGGKKLDKFDLADEAKARAAAQAVSQAALTVQSVQLRPTRRHPAPPFTTSTLQQEAARKLGFSAKQTMQIAQRLYEGVEIGGETTGLITYMRTDGVTLAQDAIATIRAVIEHDFGRKALPAAPRVYKSKQKNAQEAHEAIRPTDAARRPDQVARYLDRDQARLYELIWKRAVACQMEAAALERTTVEIADAQGRVGLRATGTVVIEPGFLKLYEEGRDDPSAEDEDANRLPKMAEGESLDQTAVKPAQHFTEPPPRYSEASLVKKLEELGIGRPSTYAAILSVLRERDYVRLDKNRFIPDDKGRLVTAFLMQRFGRYFDYDFTANLEEKLDAISASQADWKAVLRDFWLAFTRADERGDDDLLSVTQAIDALDKVLGNRGDVIRSIDELLGPHFFPDKQDGSNPRACPSCGTGRLGIQAGKNGAFVACSNYPDCRYTRPLGVASDNGQDMAAMDGPKELGLDPESGEMVSLRAGPYGPYVQLGEADPQSKAKPKRASIPKSIPPDSVTLEMALKLLSMPREVGLHPETQKPILAGLGRFGPYLNYDGRYLKLASAEEALEIGLNRAVAMIAEAPAKGRGRAAREVLRALGDHPDGGPVEILNGRYGPYLHHDGVNAPIPKGVEVADVTMAMAVEALAARAGSKKKTAAKKPAVKKAATKTKAKAKTKTKAKAKAS